MAAYEVLLLNTAVPQIQAAQAGDTYVVPRDIAFSAVANLANGTYLLPALAFSSDPDTGIFRQGANQLGFTAGGGTDQMVLTSTGLGIGTSSPTTKLTVYAGADGDVGFFRGGSTRQVQIGTSSTAGYINTDNGSAGLEIRTQGTARMYVDNSGNLGLGVTPSANAGQRGLFVSGVDGGYSAVSIGASQSGYGCVGYNIGFTNVQGTFKALATDAMSWIRFQAGSFQFFQQAAATAGTNYTGTQALTLDANRNLLLNGTSAGASAVGTLAIFNGTAPTGSVTDGIILYAEDVSSSSELKVRDEAGNVTTLSPHNFSLIPEGPSEDMAWAYYSEKGGKRINVDMLKLARMVEQLTGEKLVYEA